MSRFVTNTTHPLIENANEYMLFKKYVSIHSEDRDVIKYPNASYFELDLPQDYLNVSTVTLSNYTFPMYYNVFSISQNNVFFTFNLVSYPTSPLSLAINNTEFTIIITEGTYTSTTMATELTNKMNEAVNLYLISYMINNSIDPTSISYGGYTDFVVAFNVVSQTLWFGNTTSAFVIANESPLYRSETLQLNALLPETVQTFINWGLPAYLGFFQSNAYSRTSNIPPRFYYGDALTAGDNGYWLTPASTTSEVYFLEAPRKLNILGESYFYMDIQLLNTMDELAPFSSTACKRETSTNQSNGINNSAFAKIPTDPTSQQGAQLFNSSTYKVFYPPAERIRKLRIKLRFHDGRLVNFDNFNYSFCLIFTVLTPQNLRNATCIDPTLSQGFNNSFGNINKIHNNNNNNSNNR